MPMPHPLRRANPIPPRRSIHSIPPWRRGPGGLISFPVSRIQKTRHPELVSGPRGSDYLEPNPAPYPLVTKRTTQFPLGETPLNSPLAKGVRGIDPVILNVINPETFHKAIIRLVNRLSYPAAMPYSYPEFPSLRGLLRLHSLFQLLVLYLYSSSWTRPLSSG